ncbi:MAG: transcriptional regulator [Terriglobales bacterium]
MIALAKVLRNIALVLAAFSLLLLSSAWAAEWKALGPEGGDVRSLTPDPRNPDRIFLGTSTGSLFVSNDGGRAWTHWVHFGSGEDYVLDHLVFDPQNPDTIYVAAWSVENPHVGDLFRSQDGGKNWFAIPDLHNKSLRALSLCIANPKVLVAGAADGIYRTKDGGNSWTKISAGNTEIRDLQSIAVDPKNPDVIYAGTLHLPWKTVDGGASWQRITQGMIQDSDVFSIIVDPNNPSVVYASACSGIYHSENGAALFQKVNGMPFTARRTRVLKQDPNNPSTVYAGTTEGLWKTTDAGKTFKLMGTSEVVVNDVLIDPRNSQRVLLATDRGGVAASDDGAHSFTLSNKGYTHRYVSAIVADKTDPNTIYAAVVNDQELGGVFVSRDLGQHWTQNSTGLKGSDVFTLKQAPGGELVAGTNHGIFMLARGGHSWTPANDVVAEKVTTKTVTLKGGKKTTKTTKTPTHSVLTARVNEIVITPKSWMAATSTGLYTSTNQGKSWSGGPVMGNADFVAIEVRDDFVVLAMRTSLLVSTDGGSKWQDLNMRKQVSRINDVTLAPIAGARPGEAAWQILVASPEGAFRSADMGAKWEYMQTGLPRTHISSINYDESGNRLLATSNTSGVIYTSGDAGSTWQSGPDSGYPLRHVVVVNGRFLAATSFNGVVAQPEAN